MKFGVVILPGSNSDHDAAHITSEVLGASTELLWHADTDLAGSDCIIIPGGFAYGDYLRAGALSKFAPIMGAVRDHANDGGLVIGICNGFQILTETGMLPGALIRNEHLRFVSRRVPIRCETSNTPFTCEIEPGRTLEMPIAHGEGNYYADAETIARLEEKDQIVFRYADSNGSVDETSNPNGSINSIAGIVNEGRNVLGLMPHPERDADPAIGKAEGLAVFRSIVSWFERDRERQRLEASG